MAPAGAPRIELGSLELSNLVDSYSAERPQYFQVSLQGVHNEFMTGNRLESGYGIVKKLTTVTGVWMRPTASISDNDLPNWPITHDEYTADYRYLFQVDFDKEKIPAVMLTIPDHAVYPWLLSQRYPSSDTIVVRTALGNKPRFSRSCIVPRKDSLVVIKKYFACSHCGEPLRADAYVYCSRCNTVTHCACTESSDRQPFELRNNAFYDLDAKQVQCPTCTKSNDCGESYVKSQVVADSTSGSVMYVCMDLGSEYTKVSAAWGNDKTLTPSFKKVAGTPVSTVWVANNTNDDKPTVHVSDDRYAPTRLFDNLEVFQPIKTVLFQTRLQSKAKELGADITQMFQVLFENILEKLGLAHAPDLRNWANTANEGSSQTELRLSIALPSGLSMAQKQPVSNALYKAGLIFMTNLRVKDPTISVSVMLESEMAMLGTFESCKGEGHEPTKEGDYVIVVDCGGTSSVSFCICLSAHTKLIFSVRMGLYTSIAKT